MVKYGTYVEFYDSEEKKRIIACPFCEDEKELTKNKRYTYVSRRYGNQKCEFCSE